MAEVLTQRQLKTLKEHKYNATDSSILAPHMNKFWNWFVTLVPLWLAPNTLTITGLIVNVVTALILFAYAPTATEIAPGWPFVLFAMGLFVFQTLDAIDGKQARRTNSASPLGELFDHGCDSVSTIYITLAFCIALRIGSSPGWLMFVCMCSMYVFYASHWRTYVSGKMEFYQMDVTEAQIGMMVVHLVTAALGQQIWENILHVPLLGNVQIKYLFILSVLVPIVFSTLKSFEVIILRGGVGKNGTTVANTSVLFPALPIGSVISFAYLAYCGPGSNEKAFRENCVVFLTMFGMVGAKVTNRLVVAHMTKSELALLDTSLLGPLAIAVNHYFGSVVPEHIAVWVCLCHSLVDLLKYCAAVCNQICDYLEIACFSISRPAADDAPRENQADVAAGGLRARQGVIPDDTNSSANANNALSSPQHQTRSVTSKLRTH